MGDEKTSILIQDQQARLRMTRLEEAITLLNTDIQALGVGLSTLAKNLQTVRSVLPSSGNCSECHRLVYFNSRTGYEMNSDCRNEGCPCGLNESTHAINS